MSYPSQHHGDCPTGYTIHQPIEDSDEDSGEYSEEYSDENREIYYDKSLRECPLDPLDEPSVDTPAISYINDPPEQSMENPNRYFYGVSEAPQGSYQTAGIAPTTQAFRSLGLTSWDAQPGHNQPDYTSQTAGAVGGNYERPPFPDPDSNPYGPVAQNITGFEVPGFEPPYLLADDWWLRMSLASNYDLEHVARTLQRTTASVAEFVRVNNVAWTQDQNAKLREMNVGEYSDMSYVRQHLYGSANRYDSEILARAKYLESLAETPQPGSQQYPAGPQSAGPVAPRATRSNKPWEGHELRKLQEFVDQHGFEWHKMRENEIPGRSRAACANKGRDLLKYGQRHLELHESEGAIQRFLDNESGDQEQARNGLEELTVRDLNYIKVRLARNSSMEDIVNDRYRGFRLRTVFKLLYFQGGWKPWTSREDDSLCRMLGPEGVEWSAIINNFREPPRSKEELEARLGHVRQVKNGELPGRTRAPPYKFEEEDDNYIRLGCAKGMSYTQMQREEFPDLSASSVGHHARFIGAVWEAAHDLPLLNVNPEPGAVPDFASIGQWWVPPLHPDLVRERWNFVHSDKYASRSQHQRGH